MKKLIKYEKAEGGGYVLLEDYKYYSKRYNRTITLRKRMWSDGATGFIDLGSTGFWARVFTWLKKKIHKIAHSFKSAWFFVHDQICNEGMWDDGTLIDNWTASTVAGDILWVDGWRLLSVPVWWATYLFGGGKARENGMRRVVI